MGKLTERATEQRAAIDLQKEEGWKSALKIADDLVKDFERQALSSSDAGAIVKLAGEAKGARKMRDRLLQMLADIAKPETKPEPEA